MTRRQAGLSLLEVVIASVILIVVISVAFTLMFSSSSHYEGQSVQLALDDRVREVVNQIAGDLRMTRGSMLVNYTGGTAGSVISPSNSQTYTGLQFRVLGKLPPGTTMLKEYQQSSDRLFTRLVRYYWKPAFGENPTDTIDNNGNGLIDEGDIMKTEQDLDPAGIPIAGTTRNSKICMDVKKNGLSFKYPVGGAGRIEVTLDLEKLDPKDRQLKISRTVQSTIEMRN